MTWVVIDNIFVCYLVDAELEAWSHRGVVVITTAQLQSTKPEISFSTGSNPVCGMSKIRDGENLWQWSQLEINLNTFAG